MAESQIEEKRETQKEPEVKQRRNIIKPLGISREDTECKHCRYKESESQCKDFRAIDERRSTTRTTKGKDDDIINVEIKINNEYVNLVPELTNEEYESLKESIKQYGLWFPLTVNQHGVLLAGHHRYKVCQELGIEPHHKVKEFNNDLDEKLFVIDSNLKRRHLNNFLRIKLALKSKSIKEEIAMKNSQSNLRQNCSSSSPSVRNLTVDCVNSASNTTNGNGRVDEQIGAMAGVSRDTVRKVEKILQYIPEEGEVMQKLKTGKMSINQAYKSIYKEESIKKQLQAHHLSNSVISNNITANTAATSTTPPTANLTSHVLEIKEGDRLIRSTEKSSEGDDIIKQNCELKQEIQNLREQISP